MLAEILCEQSIMYNDLRHRHASLLVCPSRMTIPSRVMVIVPATSPFAEAIWLVILAVDKTKMGKHNLPH